MSNPLRDALGRQLHQIIDRRIQEKVPGLLAAAQPAAPAPRSDTAGTFTGAGFARLEGAPAWMPMYERTLLYGLTVGLRPRTVLEVGTFQGGSTVVMCAALDDLGDGTITCVDPNPRVAPETWAGVSHRATLVAKGSPEAIEEARATAGAPFDFALIDGDHSRAGVDRDIDATLPAMADEAHLLFHDAHYHEVRDAIDAALERHAGLHDAGLVSRGHTTDEHGVDWGGLRLLRYTRL